MNAASVRTSLLAVALVFVVVGARADSTTPSLVSDRASIAAGEPSPSCRLGNVLLFTGYGYGGAPGGVWRTDGSDDGTTIVLPILGANSLTLVGNVVCFAANDGIHGRELWQTDGSTTGTFLVRDMQPGPIGSQLEGFHAMNGTLYFNAETSNGYKRLHAYTPAPAPPPPDPADLNHDGKVDAADVVALVNRVTSSTVTSTPAVSAKVEAH